jgi:6-phosphofructokinase 1
VATLQCREGGFHLDSMDANRLRDRWGVIHARPLPLAFYDAKKFQPSPQGIQYFRSMFTNALGAEDVECIRSLFDTGNLVHPYDSVNTHINKRIRRIAPEN